MRSEESFAGIIGRTVSESVPSWSAPLQAPAGAPNIVFVVFDDVGFSDFGCYGSEIETPNIDALAASGLRYTGFHTTALCSPTRACLLTGRNHHSVGMGMLASWDSGFPGMRGRISRNAGTLAEILREHGYNTFATGKWHLTPTAHSSAVGPYDQWPLQRGFDRFYGFLAAATNQWRPALTYDNHHIDPPERPDYHLTPDIVDRSIEFVRDQKSLAPEKPFFLYMCLGACHAPHHVPHDYIEKYVPVFEKGWDQVRADRLARQIAMGIVPRGTSLPPRNDGVQAWEALSADAKRLAVRLQAAYAGMLDHADRHIGRFLSFLQAIGQFDNTFICVLSDNGASQEGTETGTTNGMRFFNRVAEDVATNLEAIGEIGGMRVINNYPTGWAMAGNTPLKRYKGNTHGGGVRDPLIIRWPVGIRQGIRSQFHHVVDLVPTVLEVVGVEGPRTLAGFPQKPIEGTSMVYSFSRADAPSGKSTQYFEITGHRGIWHRGWKAVSWHRPGTRYDDDQWELYHLETDFSESTDLARQEPERLRQMIELWWAEAGRYGVLPLDDTPRPRWSGRHARGHTQYVLYAGVERVPGDAAPDIRNRSYEITAEVVGGESGAEGVLLAHGDAASGYAFYVRSGHLVFDYNFVGTHYVVTSDAPLAPAARNVLGFRFKKTGDHRGFGTLWVNGRQAGTVDMPRTLRRMPNWAGLDVGRGGLVPVGEYEGSFAFTGTVERVVVSLGDDQDVDVQATVDAEFGTQ